MIQLCNPLESLLELSILFGTIVAYDVGVRVRLPEQRHFAVGYRERLRQQSLDGHVPVVVPTAVHEGTFTTFTQQMTRIELHLAHLLEAKKISIINLHN